MKNPSETLPDTVLKDPEVRKAIEQAEKIGRLRHRVAKKGLAHFERAQKLLSQQEELVADLVEVRDQIREAYPDNRQTEGLSFDTEDGLFRVTLRAYSTKKLNRELAEQAKVKVDAFIDSVTSRQVPPEVKELIAFLTTLFQAHGDRLNYSKGVHDFLSRDFSHPDLIAAKELLQDAIEESEKRFDVRYFSRKSKDEEWTQVTLTWFHQFDVVKALLDRRKEERKQKRQK